MLQNGVESMAATLAERRGLTLDHSREWLRYVGLKREIDGLEGEREIIEEAREVLTARRAPHRGRDPALDRVLPHDRPRRPPCRDHRDVTVGGCIFFGHSWRLFFCNSWRLFFCNSWRLFFCNSWRLYLLCCC